MWSSWLAAAFCTALGVWNLTQRSVEQAVWAAICFAHAALNVAIALH